MTSAFAASPRRWPSAKPDRPVDLRLFAKPNTLKNRRMGVALARDEDVERATDRAVAAASKVKIEYRD